MSPSRQRGDDCLTTFFAGLVGIVVLGGALILLLSWIFG